MLDKADQFLLQIHEQANLIFKKAPAIDAYFKPLDQIIRKDSSSHFSLTGRKMSALFILTSFVLDLTLDSDPDLTLDFALYIALTLDRDLHLALLHYLASDRNPDLVHILVRECDLDLSNARDLARDLTLDYDLSKFLQIKQRLVECLLTECYVSSETRQWLIDNLLVMTQEEKV